MWVSLGFLTGAGLALGEKAGRAAASACTARVEEGAAAVAYGALRDRIPGSTREDRDGGRPSGARVDARLGRARLVAGGRTCSVPGLRVRIPREGAPLEPGSRVLVRGVWRRSGRTGWPRPPDRQGMVAGRLESIVGSTRAAWPDRVRGVFAARLDRRLPAEAAAIAKPLVLADRTTLDWRVRQRFVDAGIVHLLAISGLHVGLIAGALGWLVGLFTRGARRWLIGAVAVAAYVVVIGAPPAAARAALIVGGHAACRIHRRPARTADLGGLAALIALSLDPLLISDVGFQLSFAGFVGVVTGHRLGSRIGGHPAWGAARRGPGGRLIAALTAGTGAFVATAPFAAIHFERVVATSIPASLLATGLVGLLLPATVLTAILPATLAGAIAPAVTLLTAVLERLAGWFASWPLRWDLAPSDSWLVAGAIGLGTITLLTSRSRRWRSGLFTAGLVAAWLVRPAITRVAGHGEALLCALDVGQGDAAVVRTGRGRWIVLDSGPGISIVGETALTGGGPPLRAGAGDAGRRIIVPFLQAHGARAIDLLTISHPHLDHFGGSGALFDAFRVRRVLDPGFAEPSAPYARFLERVAVEPAGWLRAREGGWVRIDDVTIEVLWPGADPPADANGASLAFRLSVGALRYLNTGDAPREVERRILSSVPGGGDDRVRGDILKLGHHGSRTSTALEWLRAVRPSLVVISSGRDNRYGHPHAQTMARLDSARVERVWRTDTDGTLCIEVDAAGWRITEG